MNPTNLQDATQRGLGRAAQHIGQWCSLFRPTSPADPLSPVNQILRLPAAFLPVSGRSQVPASYGQMLWQGLFDAAYTKPGDILHRADSAPGAADAATWFIASQQPLLPVLCVRVTGRIAIHRPTLSATAGIGGSSGAALALSAPILSGWPAAIIQAEGQMPADRKTPPATRRTLSWARPCCRRSPWRLPGRRQPSPARPAWARWRA